MRHPTKHLRLFLTSLAAASLLAGAAAYADDAAEHQGLLARPFELGVSGSSIEHIIKWPFVYCYAGTLGSLVRVGTKDHILSNNHVLAKENDPDNQLDPDGYNIIQPGLLDEGSCALSLGEEENIVAYLTDYVEILFGKGKNLPENLVDAAIAITNDANSGTENMVRSDGSIRDVGVLTGDPVAAVVGGKVQKSGRTTGHTFGEIVATGVKIKVKYDNGTALFVDQIEVVGLCDTDFSAGGDSGSLIATLDTGPRAAVGLLFAGGGASTFANPIQTVLSNLGVTMVHDGTGDVDDTGNPAIPSCSAGGGSVTAADDSYKLPKKSTVLTVAAPGVLDNDTGFDGSAPLLVDGTGPGHGTVVLGDDGGFIYEYTGNDRNGDGSDSFVYEITDDADVAIATVTINLASKGGGKPSGAGSASFGLEHALQVRADHEDELFEIPGVLGTGIGADASGNPVIRVYVENAAQSVDHPIPADIEGLPVRIVVTGRIEAY
ncbi:MAG: Ig-like domain-containing protein [Alphaproteobacteria bacterium]|nr:Ig-like domain-containing protein [Alphaproteobacteria bacterium]